jgi:hypothetical protein
MKPVDYKTKYLRLVKCIVLNQSIEEINYARALANSSTLKDHEIGLTAGRMQAFSELLDEIKVLKYSDEIDD